MATVLRECLMGFIQIYTVPLIHKCSYEFDINKREEGLIVTDLVGVRVMCKAIYTEILQALIYRGLLDTQNDTNQSTVRSCS
jgi:ppGpp synthetase/RelA/SpoT-type nucleotidyltranferase